MNRSNTIDLLRGFAVLIMIFANSAPYFINLDQEYFLRFLFSLAAPIFLIITGYCSQISYRNNSSSLQKHLKRIVQIFFIGAFIDFVFWQAIPLISFDILYLIAISQLVLLIFRRSNALLFWLILLGVLVANFMLHSNLNYRFDNPDYSWINLDLDSLSRSNPVQRMIYDGWFPLFPWLGLVVLGALLPTFKYLLLRKSLYFVILGLGILASSYYLLLGQTVEVRDDYLELWYPAIGYSLFIPLAMYFLTMGLINVEIKGASIFGQFLKILGRNSLFVYFIDAMLIAMVSFFDLKIGTETFLFNSLYLVVLIVLIFLCTVLIDTMRNKQVWNAVPWFVKYILGFNK